MGGATMLPGCVAMDEKVSLLEATRGSGSDSLSGSWLALIWA